MYLDKPIKQKLSLGALRKNNKPFSGTMLTRLNGGCRIGIVLWGSHFVEYISNINGERIFCDCCVSE